MFNCIDRQTTDGQAGISLITSEITSLFTISIPNRMYPSNPNLYIILHTQDQININKIYNNSNKNIINIYSEKNMLFGTKCNKKKKVMSQSVP